ncbi:MAG: tRNA pseudouridine(13) synthase TruD [Pseudomonadota bacterium]|nr:tRNA pseudouridine(13) synthase TruD [Pseudomonadota bacterium]
MSDTQTQTTPASTPKADFSSLAYVLGKPILQGMLKTEPEDFRVEEQIAYELSGEGEHLWCWVEKRCENTDWVAGMLAKWAGTSKRNVGFAGQKDRQAVTKQWFSIQLPGKEDPNPDTLNVEGVKILSMKRHNRKLQRGGLSGNRFELVIRDISKSNSSGGEMSHEAVILELNNRLQSIAEQGVPNYFGEQRFGKGGNNLREGEKLLTADNRGEQSNRRRGSRKKSGSRNQQSLYISALRSWMFNDLLSQRIHNHTWNQVIDGDIVQLTGSDKWFVADENEDLKSLQQRAAQGDLNPTGGLFGDGTLPTLTQALAIEETIIQKYQAWCDALAKNRVKQDRRPLRLMAENLTWSIEEVQGEQLVINLKLAFTLPAGSFATMVLREVLQTVEKGYSSPLDK